MTIVFSWRRCRPDRQPCFNRRPGHRPGNGGCGADQDAATHGETPGGMAVYSNGPTERRRRGGPRAVGPRLQMARSTEIGQAAAPTSRTRTSRGPDASREMIRFFLDACEAPRRRPSTDACEGRPAHGGERREAGRLSSSATISKDIQHKYSTVVHFYEREIASSKPSPPPPGHTMVGGVAVEPGKFCRGPIFHRFKRNRRHCVATALRCARFHAAAN